MPPERRQAAGIALALVAVGNGARLLRVHEVAPTVETVRTLEAVYARRRLTPGARRRRAFAGGGAARKIAAAPRRRLEGGPAAAPDKNSEDGA